MNVTTTVLLTHDTVAIPTFKNRSINIGSAEDFVRQQYYDFLNREPDAGGLAYWTQQINSASTDQKNLKRAEVSAAFFMSYEFQETGSFICNVYTATLGRVPTFIEFITDHQKIVGFMNLATAKKEFVNEFITRPEYENLYAVLPRAQIITLLLSTMQTRTGLDLSELRSEMQLDMAEGGEVLTIVNVVQTLVYTAAEFNKIFVLMQYFGYLRRGAEDTGYEFWLDVLDRIGDFKGMVGAFINSTEYKDRF